jgi:Sugar-specific transcriptional regulator TrmB
VNRLGERTERVEQTARQAETKAESAEHQARVATDLLDEKEAEPQPSSFEAANHDAANIEGVAHGFSKLPIPNLQPQELEALSKMMNVTFRTATGLGRDIGVPRNQVSELLDSLVEKGLVERTTSPNTGGPRWRISPTGVRTLNQVRNSK